MILESLKYMLLGMSVVFAFLYLLTIILELQRKIIEKYFPPKPDINNKPKPKSSKNKLKKVAAIAAAIHHQRKQNG